MSDEKDDDLYNEMSNLHERLRQIYVSIARTCDFEEFHSLQGLIRAVNTNTNNIIVDAYMWHVKSEKRITNEC